MKRICSYVSEMIFPYVNSSSSPFPVVIVVFSVKSSIGDSSG